PRALGFRVRRPDPTGERGRRRPHRLLTLRAYFHIRCRCRRQPKEASRRTRCIRYEGRVRGLGERVTPAGERAATPRARTTRTRGRTQRDSPFKLPVAFQVRPQTASVP